jgi:hypothetical protein
MSAGCPVVNVSQSLVLPLASSSCTSCLCGGHRKVEKQRSLRLKMGWSRKCYDDKCMLPITLECCRNELPLRSGHAPITLTIILEYFRNELPTTLDEYASRFGPRSLPKRADPFFHLMAHNHSTGGCKSRSICHDLMRQHSRAQ